MPACILGIGGAVRGRKLTNSDVAEKIKQAGGLETSDEWILSRTGISTRYITRYTRQGTDTTADLACYATKNALAHAGISAESIDLIIVATATPEYGGTPSTACMVQKHLWNEGMRKTIPCFDINAACTGFIYALAVADSLLHTSFNKILVIGSETLSTFIDWKDRNLAPLLGDGAGAVILTRTENPAFGIVNSYLRSSGDDELLVVPAGGSRNPATFETIERKMHFLKMNGREVFRFAVEVCSEVIEYFLKKFSLAPDDIKYIFLHQANLRITESVALKTKIPLEKYYSTIQEYGNTSSASIPLGMFKAFCEKKLQKGDNILLVGFGGGLTWGGIYLRWGYE